MSLFAKLNKNLKVTKDEDENNELVNLMKKPSKERVVPKIRNFRKNNYHQADTLYLSKDGAYSYVLVVVDTTTRQADARAMKGRSAGNILSALMSIWNGSVLDRPKVLETDPGTEFKGAVDVYLRRRDVSVKHKVGRTNRHRQAALAEYMNYVIGRTVGTKQNKKEMETGERSAKWVKDLPTIVRTYNEHMKSKVKPVKEQLKTMPTLKCRGKSCTLLEKGTKVRVLKEQSHDIITGKRLSLIHI